MGWAGDAALVILVAGQARALCPLTSDRNVLRRALERMRPTDTATNPREAILLAASLLAQRRDAQIFLLRWRLRGPRRRRGRGHPARIRPPALCAHRPPRRQRRLTALDVRRSLGARSITRRSPRCATSGAAATPHLELYREDSLIDARELTLSPGETHGEVFGIQGSASDLLRARLDVADDLAADNQAALVLQPRRQVNVLLVTAGNLFLEKALNVDPRVSLAKTAPGAAAATAAPRYDLVVLDGKAPERLPPRGRYLFIGTGGAAAPVAITGRTEHPSFLDWDRRHPVTRFLDLSSVQIARALVARPLPWGQALAQSEAGPLLVAGEKEGLRSLYIGFDLTESDLPLRVAFPILLANAIDWLMGSDAGTASLQARTGDVVPTEVPAGVRRLTVVHPDGSRHALAVEQSPLFFAATEQAGIYRFEGRRRRPSPRAWR